MKSIASGDMVPYVRTAQKHILYRTVYTEHGISEKDQQALSDLLDSGLPL